MNNEISKDIVGRFFSCLDVLKSERVIRGKQTFARRYGINRRNLWRIETQDSIGQFQLCWLHYLVKDYKVSPSWLLMGDGELFLPGWNPESVRVFVKEQKTA